VVHHSISHKALLHQGHLYVPGVYRVQIWGWERGTDQKNPPFHHFSHSGDRNWKRLDFWKTWRQTQQQSGFHGMFCGGNGRGQRRWRSVSSHTQWLRH